MERLDKNFIWLAAANLVSSVFNIAIFIYLARALEAEAFGYFSYAMTFILYLLNFVDLGLSTYGIREVAKEPSRLEEFVSNIISFKSVLATGIFIIFALGTLVSTQPPMIKLLMIEMSLLLFTTCLSSEWAFQAQEKMHMVFLSFAVTMSIQIAVTMAVIHAPSDLLKAPLVCAVAPVPIILSFLYILKFRFRMDRADLSSIRTYLGSSLAIWAITVFAQAYNSLDIVLLGFFRPAAEVGAFTVARRITGGAGLFLVVLANAVMPHLSSTFIRNRIRFHAATAKFLKMGILIIVIIFIPIILFAGQLINITVGSSYAQAAAPLRLMMLALVMVMFNLPFSTGLIAAGFERDVMKQAFASAVLSFFSNFILMPKYGMIGASISFMLAEGLALAWILQLYNIRIRKGGASNGREKRV